MILGIDPGNEQSAFVLYDPEDGSLDDKGILENLDMKDALEFEMPEAHPEAHLAIEMVASYGMPVGKTVFETCVWIGRFIEAWGGEYTKIYRKDVKMCLCGSMKAKDSNIRQALIDRYPATGSGKTPQIGTKSNKGMLYGVSKDIWAALGVAITYQEQSKNRQGE